MLFSSMIFLWVFLPVVLIIYYLICFICKNSNISMRLKNVFLLIASLVFYAWGGVYFLIIMIFSIILNFFGGVIISSINTRNSGLRKFTLFIIILINILVLGYFKYFNMLVIIIEQMLEGNDVGVFFYNILNMKGTGFLHLKTVVLPIGISFFTFQAMSYVIDVYRGDAKKQNNILDFGLYVALFPQLIAGPIVRYADVAEQINCRVETSSRFCDGIRKFCYGLGKKVILANTFAAFVDKVYVLNLSRLGMIISILFTISYALEIYYDFSGYSDMAIGLGKMFGFEFKENFNYPYMSNSVTDFWRRWHISLSTWFKEYIYIPLGGNRHGIFRTCINLMIVFLLTGIWHGANFTFIIWGVVYGIILIVEKIFLLRLLNLNKVKIINFLYTFLITNLLFVIFRSNTIFDAVTIFKQYLIPSSDYNILSFISMKYILAFAFGLLFMGAVQMPLRNVYYKFNSWFCFNFLEAIFIFSIFIYSVMTISDGTYNPFIYFQF